MNNREYWRGRRYFWLTMLMYVSAAVLAMATTVMIILSISNARPATPWALAVMGVAVTLWVSAMVRTDHLASRDDS